MENNRLLVGCTGAMDAVGIYPYLDAMANLGYGVTLWLSETARQFVHPHIARLHCDRVIDDDGPSTWDATRPSALLASLDRIVVFPATANCLGSAAHGLASNRLLTVIIGHEAPVVFFPAMGTAMWNNSLVQRNVAVLRDVGHIVQEPTMRVSSGTVKLTSQHPGLPSVADFEGQIVSVLGRQTDGTK